MAAGPATCKTAVKPEPAVTDVGTSIHTVGVAGVALTTAVSDRSAVVLLPALVTRATNAEVPEKVVVPSRAPVEERVIPGGREAPTTDHM